MDREIDAKLARILPNVQKPARYVGGEYNQIVKDLEAENIFLNMQINALQQQLAALQS